jgi:hypothetical protein
MIRCLGEFHKRCCDTVEFGSLFTSIPLVLQNMHSLHSLVILDTTTLEGGSFVR